MIDTELKPIQTLTGRAIFLLGENIDTDQIYAARFLTTTEKAGLGKVAFYDWRYDEAGAQTDHQLNSAKDRRIIVGGRNFGCGSSREHAPWALYDYGVRIVISIEIADIFRSNALKNGIAAILVDNAFYTKLVSRPDAPITVDLEKQEIEQAGDVFVFELDSVSKQCLITGSNILDLLLARREQIATFEQTRNKGATA